MQNTKKRFGVMFVGWRQDKTMNNRLRGISVNLNISVICGFCKKEVIAHGKRYHCYDCGHDDFICSQCKHFENMFTSEECSICRQQGIKFDKIGERK